jgi:4-amino-4-deoxy-L-arabinose transferase-like glycosyltransferase
MKGLTKSSLLIIILFLGAFFRFYNLNWDENQHLHPDERFLTMVEGSVSWPQTVAGYFDTFHSSLNPENVGYPFYVYGTFPIFLVKLVAQMAGYASYDGYTLVGRFLSALFDSLTIIFVYLIAVKIFKSRLVGVLSSLVYAAGVLPIQLAHYSTVDTYAVFFLVLTSFFFLTLFSLKPSRHHVLFSSLTGLAFGVSLACKISSLLFLPVIFLGFLYWLITSRQFHQVLLCGVIFLIVCLLSVRCFQPYIFSGWFEINPGFISNLKTLKSYDDPSGWFPPSVQWIKTVPYVFPLLNLFYWGWGPFLSLIGLTGLFFVVKNIRRYPLSFLPVIWIIGLFLYQGIQFAKPLRYLYPVYPFIAVCSGFALSLLWPRLKNAPYKIIFLVIIFIWPLSFLSIYRRPLTRIAASEWIYRHIAAGAVVSCESWDDCLPLTLSPLNISSHVTVVQLPLYDADSVTKWSVLEKQLSRVDYLILTSNRLYGSIMTVPEKYPLTGNFYTDLFSGKLGFVPVAQFTSRFNLPLPGMKVCLTPPFQNYGYIAKTLQDCPLSGISFVDDYADESFTVYDHPKVIIFKNVSYPGSVSSW